jgi:uncharacterized Zn finger protein
MSPWEPGDRYPRYAPKKAAPRHGIKVDKPGTTWWGKRWIEALEQVLEGDSGRLARGRTYARAGRTHDFLVEAGKVTARVTGSRAPYRVEIALPQLSAKAWSAAIERMAQKAEFSAQLLNNEMPRAIDDAFLAGGASLFPRQRADLETDCDCPDYGDPCKHIAAVHYVLGDALDRDPFLLFELRGRTREQVLEALRAARGHARSSRSLAPVDERPASISLSKLSARNYDAAPAPLPALSFSFEPPPAHGAALRQLGTPSAWNSATPALETLTPLVQTAASRARQLALNESPAPPGNESPEAAPSRRVKSRRKSRRRLGAR